MQKYAHKISAFLISSFVFVAASLPTETKAQDQAAVQQERAVTHFYMQPNLTNVYKSIEAMVAKEKTNNVINYETLSLFFAEIFRRSPQSMPAVIQHFSKYKNDLNAMPWMAAWLSGTPQGTDMVARLKTAGYEQIHAVITAAPPVDIRNFQPRNKAVIDGLWIYYYAAGDLADLARIFETAMFDKKGEDGEFLIKDAEARKAISNYAAGSLVVHAAQHPKVLQFLARSQAGAPDAVKQKVQNILTSAVTLSKQLAESGKPLDQVLEESAPKSQ